MSETNERDEKLMRELGALLSGQEADALLLLAAYREELLAPLRAEAERLRKIVPTACQETWRAEANRQHYRAEKAEAEVERLKAEAMAAPVDPSAWWKLSDECERLKFELVHARTDATVAREQRDEWKAKAEANAALFDVEHAALLLAEKQRDEAQDEVVRLRDELSDCGSWIYVAELEAKAEAAHAELDRAWKQVAITHDLLAAAWGAADPDLVADAICDQIRDELDETKCPDYCGIFDKARDAQHALEVIEREQLVPLWPLYGSRPVRVERHDEQGIVLGAGEGESLEAAVEAYEQARRKGGE